MTASGRRCASLPKMCRGSKRFAIVSPGSSRSRASSSRQTARIRQSRTAEPVDGGPRASGAQFGGGSENLRPAAHGVTAIREFPGPAEGDPGFRLGLKVLSVLDYSKGFACAELATAL